MQNLKDLPGLKLDELMKLGNCVICGKKQLEGKMPLFYCIEISRGGFDQAALQRAAGLELQVGALAQVLGPDEPLARVIEGPHRVFVHEHCAGMIHHLLELVPDQDAVELARRPINAVG